MERLEVWVGAAHRRLAGPSHEMGARTEDVTAPCIGAGCPAHLPHRHVRVSDIDTGPAEIALLRRAAHRGALTNP